MSSINLPSDILLDILEYGSNPSIDIEPNYLIERIQLIDPSFSLSHVLQDKKRELSDKLYMMNLYAYNLYSILNGYNVISFETTQDYILLHDTMNVYMNVEIQESYPNLDIHIDVESGSTHIKFHDHEKLRQVQGELQSIHYFLHRKYDPLTMKSTEGYTNRIYLDLTDTISAIIDTYNPPRFSELMMPIIYKPDNRSTKIILHDILLIDSCFDLSGELERVIRLNNLRESLSHSIWDQLQDLPWAIYPSENRIDLHIESTIPIQFPDYIDVDIRLGTDKNPHSEYYITGNNLSIISDVIILNSLNDPYNATFEVYSIYPLN